MEPLSVLVLTWNEEENLAECLASCSFAQEIVVVDSGSEDRTREIARAHGARVLVHPFESHARQKNWGLDRLRHDWVFVIDADERIPPELGAEIRRVLSEPRRKAGYWVRRRSTFLGREIRGAGWQREKVLRLFDRRLGRYEERRVHEEVRLRARAGFLKHRLEHKTCRDLASWLRKTEHYAWLGAEEAWQRGRRARAWDLAARPALRFLKQYLLQAGFRDGLEGFLLCAISAYGVFAKYARLWEKSS